MSLSKLGDADFMHMKKKQNIPILEMKKMIFVVYADDIA